VPTAQSSSYYRELLLIMVKDDIARLTIE
jgi:hypothetical protein